MLTILKNQALDRWDLVSDSLREAIVSEENSAFLWKTCQEEHVPEDRIPDVARAAGYVFLGFLHPEDLAAEIKDQLGIDAHTANLIEDALNRRIFAPVRADIDKAYSPLSTLEMAPMAVGPKMLQGVGSLRPAPLPVNKMAPPVSAAPVGVQKASTTSDVGWSKTQPVNPVVRLNTLPVQPTRVAPSIQQLQTPIQAQPQPISPKPVAVTVRPAVPPPAQAPTSRPVPAVAPVASPQASASSRSMPVTPVVTLSEFDRLNLTRRSPLTGPAAAGAHPVITATSTPTPATTPVTPSVTVTPAAAPVANKPIDPPPMMLHEDTTFKAGEKNVDFKVAQPGAQMTFGSEKLKVAVRPVVLEFGGVPTPTPKPPTTPSSVPRYSEFKPSLSSVPTANSGPRNVSQVVPAAPSIPVPVPRPPAKPPQPPSRPQSQPQGKEKVVVKNFL